jgi:hypothetical protein
MFKGYTIVLRAFEWLQRSFEKPFDVIALGVMAVIMYTVRNSNTKNRFLPDKASMVCLLHR